MVGFPEKAGGGGTDAPFRRMESGGDTRSLLDFVLPERRLLDESLLIMVVCGDVPSLDCIKKDVLYYAMKKAGRIVKCRRNKNECDFECENECRNVLKVPVVPLVECCGSLVKLLTSR